MITAYLDIILVLKGSGGPCTGEAVGCGVSRKYRRTQNSRKTTVTKPPSSPAIPVTATGSLEQLLVVGELAARASNMHL